MSTSPSPPPQPPSLPHPIKTLTKFSTTAAFPHFRKPPRGHRPLSHIQPIQCEHNSFENGAHNLRRWTVDCVTGSDPIHIILKPPSSSSPMPMATSGNGLKGSKKVCLFYAAEMEALAQRIAAQSDAIELRSINWRYQLNIIASNFRDTAVPYRLILSLIGRCCGGGDTAARSNLCLRLHLQ